MKKEEFDKKKEILLNLVNEELSKINLIPIERKSLEQLIKLMDKYSFENKNDMKGVLSRTIIDSLQINYALGEKFIQFENSL